MLRESIASGWFDMKKVEEFFWFLIRFLIRLVNQKIVVGQDSEQ